jgi:hypothetical protein
LAKQQRWRKDDVDSKAIVRICNSSAVLWKSQKSHSNALHAYPVTVIAIAKNLGPFRSQPTLLLDVNLAFSVRAHRAGARTAPDFVAG